MVKYKKYKCPNPECERNKGFVHPIGSGGVHFQCQDCQRIYYEKDLKIRHK